MLQIRLQALDGCRAGRDQLTQLHGLCGGGAAGQNLRRLLQLDDQGLQRKVRRVAQLHRRRILRRLADLEKGVLKNETKHSDKEFRFIHTNKKLKPQFLQSKPLLTGTPCVYTGRPYGLAPPADPKKKKKTKKKNTHARTKHFSFNKVSELISIINRPTSKRSPGGPTVVGTA